MAEVTGILLAAGFSSRFGSNKLLADFDRKPLIAHSSAALSPCDRVIAVVRNDDAALQTELRLLGVDCVFNTEPKRGIGHSIACGVKATANSSAWCILPADMPRVSVDTTSQVANALRNGSVLAAPFYNGQRGHPVGFGSRFLEALCALDGDAGARGIISRNAEQLTVIETDDAGVIADIDTVRDLAATANCT